MINTKNLFISHSWTYSDSYNRLVKLLDESSYFSYRNYSVPKDDPIHNANNDRELYEAITTQIRCCSVVIILAGVYSTYSKWINKEIEIAKKLNKPIIAIEPYAAEKTSSVVKANANKVVKWNSNSIVSAIREVS